MPIYSVIKVVKLYTKADALSTGAVIVDLPGVHDSNAARAAVAEGYMKQCTGLWIVAPINRAVDDKVSFFNLLTPFTDSSPYESASHTLLTIHLALRQTSSDNNKQDTR